MCVQNRMAHKLCIQTYTVYGRSFPGVFGTGSGTAMRSRNALHIVVKIFGEIPPSELSRNDLTNCDPKTGPGQDLGVRLPLGQGSAKDQQAHSKQNQKKTLDVVLQTLGTMNSTFASLQAYCHETHSVQGKEDNG